MQQKTMPFQTEVKQLLQLMIHSLYSNKEIFLRELISNSSDAIDKLRFEALSQPSLLEGSENFKIRIDFDKENHTITITDNGIGLSHDEAILHLGTIAKSGTKEFFENLSGDQKKDAALIGQFGVGFYSSFIVAEQVILESRRAGLNKNQGVRWTSKGDGEFSIETIEKEKYGTTIILHLRDNEHELLSSWRIKSIIQKYSDHIAVPIEMPKEDWDEQKKELIKKDEFEQINKASALWTRAKKDIQDEEYHNFYKHISHDNTEPLTWAHNHIEGSSEYTMLLYIPKHANFDLWDKNRHHGLKLYIKRVFIMDEAESLCPNYLRFLKGLIDSNDLPLNVSREILQESKDIKNIKEKITRSALNMLENLAKNNNTDPQNSYQIFWKEFGAVLKEGIGEDHNNKERIAKLLRFSTTHNNSPEQTISLEEYIERMKENQKNIYYVNADSFSAANNSPHLEIFRKKGYEVLLLSDRVDEWMLSFLHEYNGKPLVSVSRGSLDIEEDISEENKENEIKAQNQLNPILEGFKKILQEEVKEVRWTKRLIESPACLVVDEGEMSNHLQRLLKAAGQETKKTKPILELNIDHQLIKNLDPNDQKFSDWCHILLQQAILAEGGTLDDPATFVKKINNLFLLNNKNIT